MSSLASVSHPVQRFVACRTCRLLERITPDLTFEDEEPFVVRHAGHRLEALTRLGDAFLSDKPVWDPTATTYFEVTNGEEILMVRSGRKSIDDPIERMLVPGRLRLDHVAVEFETDLIRRALDAHFFPHALRITKLDQFLALLGSLCEEIRPNDLVIVFDSADEPQVQYARLPDPLFEKLETRCRSIFDEWEFERLRSFLVNARTDDGLLCLRVTRAFVVAAA